MGSANSTRDTNDRRTADHRRFAPLIRYQPLVSVVGYVVAWAVLWHVTNALERLTGVSLWSLPAGLTFAVLLEGGGRALPLPIVAALVAGLLVWPWQQWPYYLAISVLVPLGYFVTIQTLRQSWLDRYRRPWRFNGTPQVAVFLAAAAAGSGFAALVGTLLLKAAAILSPQAPFSLAVLEWWAGNFVGIATFAPFVLLFGFPAVRRFYKKTEAPRPSRTVRMVDPPSTAKRLVQGLLSVLLLAALFWIPQQFWREPHNPFVVLLALPVLVWIVATNDIRGAVLGVFLFESSIVLMVAAFGHSDQMLQYQTVMAVVAVSGLLAGAFSHEKLISTALYRDLAEISNDLLWEFDAAGHLRELRGKFAKSLEFRDFWLGLSWKDWVVFEQSETDLAALRAALVERQPFQHLVLCVRLPGHERWAWTRNGGVPLFDEDGEFLGYRGATVDISDQKQTEALHKKAEALLQTYDETLEAKVEAKVEERTRILAEVSLRNWRLANYDQLTSLPNRNLLFEHLRKGLQQARRQWRLLAILLVDLDGFKQVNDTLGHDAGDELLQQVAARLQQCVR
ncbi:MAG: diguanylate cyclase, partial [Candidatus Competibacter sp.]